MKSKLVRCSMTVGMFKPNLSREEREKFKNLFESEHKNFIGGTGPIFEGDNSLVYCFSLVQGAQTTNPCEIGGACFVSYTGNGTDFKEYNTEQSNEKELLDSPLSMVQNLNSSWSIVVVEDERCNISLGRDFAGAHAMYYTIIDGIFYFSSSLTNFRKLSITIDEDAVSNFLHFLYVPAPQTIYKGIHSVLPGQIMSFDGKILSEDKISFMKTRGIDFNRELDIPDDQYIFSLEEHLIKSLERVCPKNRTTALLLSGGKDSSALAIAVRQGGLKNVEAITIGFDDKLIDESNDARIVAQHLGIPFQILKFSSAAYVQHWASFVESLGQPMGDPAALPFYVIMKKFQDKYDVYLDGTGNDRYMGITTTWHENLAWHIHRIIPGLHFLPWKYVKRGFSYTLDVFNNTFSRHRAEQFVSWKGWTAEENFKLLGRKPNFWDTLLYQRLYNVSSSMVHKTLTLCDIWEPETAYRKTVQIASTHGKVMHFPYLDQDLIAYCESLPPSLKYQGYTNKIIIRLLLEKYLPPEILRKKKGVFNFPKDYILAWNNYEYIRRLLSSEGIRKYNLIDSSIANKYIDRYIKGEINLEDRIWALIVLHSWMELSHN